MRHGLKNAFLMGGAAVALIMPAAAIAQTNGQSAAPETPAAENAGTGDIVVTAQRRAENVQNVPLSVQALTQVKLQNAQVARFEDLVKISPTLTFDVRTNFSNASVRVRGLGTQVFGIGVEPSVATVIDGIVISRGAGALSDLFDVARVEVLNGPQSTLFGKNASAGIVNIVSRRPNTERLEAAANFTLAEGAEVRTDAAVSGPVSDHLALRLNAYQHYWDGNVRNIATGEKRGGYGNWGLRGKALLHDTGDFDALLTLDYTRQKTECCVRILETPGTVTYNPALIGAPGTPQTAGQLSGLTVGPFNDKVNVDHQGYTNTTSYGATLEMNYKFGDYTLTSLTGARRFTLEANRDNDETPLAFSQQAFSNEKSSWVTQELRITSPQGKPIDYVAGGYFYDAKTTGRDYEVRRLTTGAFEDRDIPTTVHSLNLAAFGQANWHLTDKLTAIVGARYIYDRIKLATRNDGFNQNAAGAFTSQPLPEVSNRKGNSAVTGKVGLQYFFTPAFNAFATYSRGFKGSAIDTDPVNINFIVKPERSNAYEAGLRTTLFDRRVRFNLTMFRTDVENLQITFRDLTIDRSRLGSVPKVRTQGIELDSSVTPTTGLTLTAAGTYLDAKYRDFTNSPCYLFQTAATGCVNNIQNLSGVRLANAPKWKGVFSTRYEYAVANWKPFIQYDVRVQSGAIFLPDNNPAARQNGYAVHDASIGASLGSRFTATFFVKNLFDRHYRAGFGVNGATAGGIILHTIPRDWDRYAGVNLSFNY
jgi:iron complex outermembrane receptor protein